MTSSKYVSERDGTARGNYSLLTGAGADIKTAYEAESNTNAYTDTEKSDLTNVISLLTPPEGKCKITKLYVDPSTGKLAIEYDDTPV